MNLEVLYYIYSPRVGILFFIEMNLKTPIYFEYLDLLATLLLKNFK